MVQTARVGQMACGASDSVSGIWLQRLAQVVDAVWSGPTPETPLAAGVCIDSRTLQRGELFWALPGTRTDGHRFVTDAATRGAVAAVVSRPLEHSPAPLLVVPDTVAALARAAAWYRSCLSATVIGITGSAGKTTTKQMLATVLAGELAVHATPGNQNNLLGLPLTILNTPRATEMLVLEHGTSEPGEIRSLAAISRPHWAVLTTIGAAHLAGLGSIEGVLREKLDLVRTLPRDGLAFVNADCEHLAKLRDRRMHCRIVWYGFGHMARLLGPRATWRTTSDGSELVVDGDCFRLPVQGRPFAYAALVAVLVARELGLSRQAIANGLAAFRPLSGRLRVVDAGPARIIDDSYNANPVSLEACVELLDELARRHGRHRVLVLGDMLELGPDAEREHRRQGTRLAEKLDVVIAVGELAEAFATAAAAANPSCRRVRARDAEQAATACLPLLASAVIAVKGSRAMRLDQTVAALLRRAGPTIRVA